MPQPDWTTSNWADGPKVAAWVKAHGHLRNLPSSDSRVSRVAQWEKGVKAGVAALDRMLTSFGRHLSELPDDVWL